MAGQSNDFYDIIKAAEAEGWTSERTGRNHWRLNPPEGVNGGRPIFTSGTPGDFRAYQNFLTKLRKAGFNYRKGKAK
jgi:hypothetical protein